MKFTQCNLVVIYPQSLLIWKSLLPWTSSSSLTVLVQLVALLNVLGFADRLLRITVRLSVEARILRR